MLAEALAMEKLKDGDVVALTTKGERDLLEPGTTLTPSLLEVLILMDGHSTVAQLRKRARGATKRNLGARLNELIERELVRVSSPGAGGGIDPGDFLFSNAHCCFAPSIWRKLFKHPLYCVSNAA